MQENKNKSYKQNFILEYEVWFLLRVYPVLTEYYKKYVTSGISCNLIVFSKRSRFMVIENFGRVFFLVFSP